MCYLLQRPSEWLQMKKSRPFYTLWDLISALQPGCEVETLTVRFGNEYIRPHHTKLAYDNGLVNKSLQ